MNRFRKMINDDTIYKDFDHHFIDKHSDILKGILPNNIIKSHTSRYLNWIEHNGDYYYFKQFNLNDFIGEELCKFLDISSATYDLAMIRGGIQTISKSFINDEFRYYNIKNIYKYFLLKSGKEHSIYTLDTFLKAIRSEGYNEKVVEKLLDDILKMSAIDYFSRQTDRYFNNYMLMVKDGFIGLAPLYDFGESFCFHYGSYMNYGYNYAYTNELINISWANHFYQKLAEKYPNLQGHLSKMLLVDLKNIIETIVSRYNLTITDELLNIYQSEEDMSKERIKVLIK